MASKGVKLASLLVVSTTTLLLTEAAGAKSTEVPKAQEAKVTEQGAGSKKEVGESTRGGSRPEEAQYRADIAATHARNLDQQTRDLSSELEALRETSADSKAQLEERSRSAYKGDELAGVSLVLRSLIGGKGADLSTTLNGRTVQMLANGRQSVRSYRDSQRALKDAVRRLERRKEEYRESRREQRTRTEEFRRREAESGSAVGGFASKNEQMETRIAQLEADERAGKIALPPASGGGGATRERELAIAQEDI